MFDDRLKKIRENKNITVRQAATALDLPYTTYNNYEKNSREPNGEVLCRIADFFQVSVDFLLGRTNVTDAVASKAADSAMQSKFSALDRYGKKLVAMLLDAEYERCMEQQNIHQQARAMITLRSSSYRVSAGTGFLLDDNDQWHDIQVPDTPEARHADYALTISGDSMEPIYHNGDVVLVKQTDAVDVGEVGIFVVDGSGYIKKFGGDRLISLNDAYADIRFTSDSSVRCCGKVIGSV